MSKGLRMKKFKITLSRTAVVEETTIIEAESKDIAIEEAKDSFNYSEVHEDLDNFTIDECEEVDND